MASIDRAQHWSGDDEPGARPRGHEATELARMVGLPAREDDQAGKGPSAWGYRITVTSVRVGASPCPLGLSVGRDLSTKVSVSSATPYVPG
jgi:hypothetical protein